MRRYPHSIVVALAVIAHLGWRPVPGAAEGIKLMAELEYVETDSSSEDRRTLETTDSDSTRVSQLYHLDISRQIYPNLLVGVGGLMDTNATETTMATETIENRDRTTQPYVDLRLTTPAVQAASGYRRTEVKNTATGAATMRTFVDQYTGELNLNVADWPQLAMNYTRLLASDEPETTDAVNELFTLRGRYQWRDLSMNYDHSTTNGEDRIADAASSTQVDSGRVSYGRRFLDDRLAVTFGARINRTAVTTEGSGATRVPTAAPGSLFSFSGIGDPIRLTPEDFQPFVEGSNAINIGQSGGLVPVGVGLDFGSATAVDTLYVPIKEDPAVPNLAGQVAAIAGSLTWRLFVSDDQEVWQEAGIGAVSFNMVFGRFEIALAVPQDVRFLHLVVTPTLVPGAPESLFIAGLQPLVTLPGGAGNELESIDQSYNVRLQFRVSDQTTAGYDLAYQWFESTPGDFRRFTLTNGVNAQHRFNDVYTGTARLVRSDSGETDQEDRVTHSFAASLRGGYLPTFSQTLTYSAVFDHEEDGDSATHGVVLRNNAELYRGWSMNVDLGASRDDPAEGGATATTFARLGTHLVPNGKTNLDLNYAANWTSQPGEDALLKQQGNVQIFLVPFPTLSLFAGVSFEDDEAREEGANVLQNYSVSWLPFPDGTLQFSVSYSEVLRNDGEETKSFSPILRWQVFRKAQVVLQYTAGTVETLDEIRDFASLSANLRLIY